MRVPEDFEEEHLTWVPEGKVGFLQREFQVEEIAK